MVILLAAIQPVPAAGDAAPPFYPSQGSLKGITSSPIRLVTEKVVIGQFKDSGPYSDATMQVSDTYLFENTGDYSERVNVTLTLLRDSEMDTRSLAHLFSSVVAIVDGERVSMTPSAEPVPGSEGYLSNISTGFGIVFAPLQRRTVVISMPLWETPVDKVDAESPFALFVYHLQSAHAWRGPMENLEVRVEFPSPMTMLSGYVEFGGRKPSYVVDNWYVYRFNQAEIEADFASNDASRLITVNVTHPHLARDRLQALEEAKKAIELHPDDVTAHAKVAAILASFPQARDEYLTHVDRLIRSVFPDSTPSRIKELEEMWAEMRVALSSSFDCMCNEQICTQRAALAKLDAAGGLAEDSTRIDICCCLAQDSDGAKEVELSEEEIERGSEALARLAVSGHPDGSSGKDTVPPDEAAVSGIQVAIAPELIDRNGPAIPGWGMALTAACVLGGMLLLLFFTVRRRR